MGRIGKSRLALIIFGDIMCFFAALFLVLAVRFRGSFISAEMLHIEPFSAIFIVWVVIFYILKLYDLKEAKNRFRFFGRLILAFTINFFLASAVFYVLPLGITPKTNLALTALLSFAMMAFWRVIINKAFSGSTPVKVRFSGKSPEIAEIKDFIRNNRQIGFMESESSDAGIIVADEPEKVFKRDENFSEFAGQNKKIFRTVDFYELVFERVPVSAISFDWMLFSSGMEIRPLDIAKRFLDLILSIFFLIAFAPVVVLAAAAIKFDSSGPVFFRQKRIGAGGKVFTIWKLRTMVKNAGDLGPECAEEKDKRITRVGRLFRKLHIDEIPQLWNILKGDMSFVGPRPENRKLVIEYGDRIKFYTLRHFVRPGIMGWAQLNYPYGVSKEDAEKKLEYDLYYVKNRSLVFDLGIIIQTLRRVFEKHSR